MLVLIHVDGAKCGIQAFDMLDTFDNWAYSNKDDFDNYDCLFFKNRSYSEVNPNVYDKTVEGRIKRVRSKWIAKAGEENIR